MKKLILLFALIATLVAMPASAKKVAAPLTFENGMVHDFGNIAEKGGPVSHEFTFVNDGTEPVVIISATSSCGCTRPDFPKKPVQPGKKGTIKVTYYPNGRPGEFLKEVRVKTSDKQHKIIILKIAGVVIPDPSSAHE